MNSATTTLALFFNGAGMWAVALAIFWMGQQPHTVLLGGADPHFSKYPVRASSDVTLDGFVTVASDAGGFMIDPSGGTLSVDASGSTLDLSGGTLDLNLSTAATGIDVNISK